MNGELNKQMMCERATMNFMDFKPHDVFIRIVHLLYVFCFRKLISSSSSTSDSLRVFDAITSSLYFFDSKLFLYNLEFRIHHGSLLQ